MRRLLLLSTLAALVSVAWIQGGDNHAPILHHVTLDAHDFLRHSVSLGSGEYGKGLQGRKVVNIDSELDFGNYDSGFTVGIQGGQQGLILDLGTSGDLAARYGYDETVGGGQGFASIHFRDGQLVILDDRNAQTYQPFLDGIEFLDLPPTGSDSAPAMEGHIYLVHIVNRHDSSFERIAKIMVTHRDHSRVSMVFEDLQRNFADASDRRIR